MKQRVLDILLVLLGNTIYALGIVLFILPSHLVMGGTTGIGLILTHFFDISLPVFVFVFNTIMFLIGYSILGKKFAMRTIISTFYYPFILQIIQMICKDLVLTDDLFLNMVFGGLFIGVAIGIVVRVDASTGGMDIPPLILHKLFRLPVSATMNVFDVLILLGQFSFSDTRHLMYGIILIFVYTYLLDKVMFVGKKRFELKIISNHSKEIKEAIMKELDRGVTLLHAQTGYLEKEMDVVLTVVNEYRIMKVERLVKEIDPDAFIIIDSVFEVQGRGFSKDKQYLTK